MIFVSQGFFIGHGFAKWIGYQGFGYGFIGNGFAKWIFVDQSFVKPIFASRGFVKQVITIGQGFVMFVLSKCVTGAIALRSFITRWVFVGQGFIGNGFAKRIFVGYSFVKKIGYQMIDNPQIMRPNSQTFHCSPCTFSSIRSFKLDLNSIGLNLSRTTTVTICSKLQIRHSLSSNECSWFCSKLRSSLIYQIFTIIFLPWLTKGSPWIMKIKVGC